MSGSGTRSRKRVLRESMRKRRNRMGGPLHGETLLPHWPDSFADLSVAGYYPMNGEFDCRALLQTLRYAGVATGLPRMRGKAEALEFRRWRPGQALVDGDYGTREPSLDAPTFVPDIVLVPLLAFDAGGGRLGYGGGYYDRTLAAYPGALAVGVAFDAQEVDAVPMEAHDRRLDAVLTESGLRDFISKGAPEALPAVA